MTGEYLFGKEGSKEIPPLAKGGRGDLLGRLEKSGNMLYYNEKLRKLSRELRKNMTDAEKLLWSRIRRKQLKGSQFYRQKIIGNYIVDFYCTKAKLVIELDGGQHYTPEGQQKDRVRDDYLSGVGLKVARFSDKEVFDNIEGVLETIWEYL